MLVVLLLLTWFVLSVLLAAWTLWFQSYIYSEPAGEMQWRAPAAGAGITLFLLLWVVIDYNSPGNYREIHKFSYTEDLPLFPELHILNHDGKEESYQLGSNPRGVKEYHRKGRSLPSRPDRIVAIRGDDKYVFEPERRNGKFVEGIGGVVHYHNAENGWEMVEGQLGYVTISHFGRLIGNLLLNALHLAVWFVCLWLLLRFQWSHALGQAIVCWLAVTFLVLPGLLDRAEAVYKERHPPAGTTPAAIAEPRAPWARHGSNDV
jgi:hypothetical protein